MAANRDAPFSADFDFNFSDHLNGVGEYGIAAGADEFSDPKFKLTVLTRDASVQEPDVAMPARLAAAIGDYNNAESAGKHGMANAVNVFTADVLEWLGFASRADIPAGHTIAAGDMRAPPRVEVRVPWVAGTLSVNYIDFGDGSVSRWYVQAIAFLLTTGWIVGFQGNANVTYLNVSDSLALYTTRQSDRNNNVADALFNPPAYIRGLVDQKIEGKKLGTVIVATKISWYLTNHHVGQTSNAIASFLGKVVKIDDLLSAADPSVVRRMLWAIGKYTVTIDVLRCCGLGGLVDTSAVVNGQNHADRPLGAVAFSVSEDVRLRMSGRPAGTAGVMTYFALARHASTSNYAVLLPAIVEYGTWHEAEERVKAEPARFHMGSMFLTGQPRIILDTIKDETAMVLAGYIHAVAPSSNLAKAPVILRKEEVHGSTVYTMIQSVKADLTAMSTNAVLKKLMNKAAPGTAVGGFALQINLISPKDVEDASAEVEAEREATTGKTAAVGPIRAV